jgi:hypothetical protein
MFSILDKKIVIIINFLYDMTFLFIFLSKLKIVDKSD